MQRFFRPPESPRRPRCPSSISSSSDFSSSFSVGANDVPSSSSTNGEILLLPRLREFTYNELKVANKKFVPESFNDDYCNSFKGWISEQPSTASSLNSGMFIDVKELESSDLPGLGEWMILLNYLSRLHHPHLVRLIGFCSENGCRLLVHESLPKGTLYDHLFGMTRHAAWIGQLRQLRYRDSAKSYPNFGHRRSGGLQPLSWATRIKIATGVAKGLSFLHGAADQVIHGNIRASNIILDSELNAKLSGFSLAEAGGIRGDVYGRIRDRRHDGRYEWGEVHPSVFPSDRYAAPEYIDTGELSTGADVYSFGVVLFEILSGCCPSRSCLEKHRAGSYLRNARELYVLMDSKLGGQYPHGAARTMMKLALLCTEYVAKHRPDMSYALRVLEGLNTEASCPML